MTHQHPSPSQPLSEEERALAAGYVLGDLTDEEQQQMLTLLKRADMQQEVKALRVSLRSLPKGLSPVAPPSSLESKILTAYEATSPTQPQHSNPPTLQPSNPPTPQLPKIPTPPPKSKIQNRSPSGAAEPTTETFDKRSVESRSRRSPKSQVPWSKIIASMATLVALWLSVSNARLRYQLAQRPDSETVTDTQSAVEILQQPNSRLVSLQGRDETNTGAAGGTLLFQKGKWQEIVVSLNNLPPLPVDQVYRMWLTLDDGNVLFCGEFNTQTDGTILVKLNPPELPPQGVKTTGLFVTQDANAAPLTPNGTQLMVGEI